MANKDRLWVFDLFKHHLTCGFAIVGCITAPKNVAFHEQDRHSILEGLESPKNGGRVGIIDVKIRSQKPETL